MLHVLVIDDCVPLRGALASLLRERLHDASVREARSVAEAAHCVRARPADVVLSDLGLPDARGITAFRTVRALAPHARLAVYAASPLLSDRVIDEGGCFFDKGELFHAIDWVGQLAGSTSGPN